MRPRRLVLVFARAPREETREKPLGGGAPRRVQALHESLFRRTLAVARRSGVRTRLVTQGEPRDDLRGDLEVVQQVGTTFAERLARAMSDAFAEGWQEVVLIGGDTPALDRTHLRDAFAALAGEGRRAVLGPACDGGYYLLALNAFSRTLFSDEVPFGTCDAGRVTEQLLAREGFALSRLAPLHDVDDEADVRRLAQRRGALRAAASMLLHATSSFVTLHLAPVRRFVTTVSPRGPPRSAPTPL